ncbi:MAG: glycoside hydrolase family 55 protein [Armatimonadetes bacterium]|nr:glycoside hydrolase family 55 protein [Armatimonadota bacterium]
MSLYSYTFMLMTFGMSLSLLLSVPSSAQAENIVFPKDAGIVNVREWGAMGDGIQDDTPAIQKAIDAHPNRNKIIYLPNGVYRISDTIRWSRGPRGGSEEKRIILQGQSEKGAILKLKDRCPGFTDPAIPKAMVWTGEKPAQRFRNSIRNLTFDTGTGNPGAIGAQYMANNQGTFREVTIRSGDGQGVIGLDLGYSDENGPCLIKNVRIYGFETGIKTRHAVDSLVFENIHLEGQKRYGFHNEGQVSSIRKLRSVNAVPALYGEAGAGMVALIDSVLTGTKGAGTHPAIRNEAALFARNLRVSGYAEAIHRAVPGKPGSRGVLEYVSHPVLHLFPTPRLSLKLPIRETPTVPWDDLKEWASPSHFGAKPGDGVDDSVAIQKAIDSGKTTVYLPNGTWEIGKTVVLRGNVRRFIGTEADVHPIAPLLERKEPLFRFEGGKHPVVVMERFSTGFHGGPFYFLHNAARRTLVMSSVSVNFQGAASYHNSGTGPLFIEDVVGGDWIFMNQPVWARQFNVENRGTHVMNDGGTLWILGYKTERGGTLIETRGGGKTELIGGFSYTTEHGKLAPMFVNHESSVSLTIGESWFNRRDSPFVELVRETRDGVTRTLKIGEAPGRTGGSMLPLYVGYKE